MLRKASISAASPSHFSALTIVMLSRPEPKEDALQCIASSC